MAKWQQSLKPTHFHMLSGLVRSRNRNGEQMVRVDQALLGILERMRLPPFKKRAEAVLLGLIAKTQKLGSLCKYSDYPELLAIGYCRDANELGFIIDYATQKGWVDRPLNWETAPHLTRALAVAPGGYVKADELSADSGTGSKVFVAMWFDPSMDDVFRDGFTQGVRLAGYEPVRVDGVEHAGKIDDEIIRQIRSAKFVIADCTGHRGGVYYEAGFAHGLGLQVFMTCRKDNMTDLHFDIRQYNCIEWETAEDLSVKLRNRIEAVFGHGPVAYA